MWGLRVSDLFIISLFRPERDVGLYSVSYNISAKSIELLVALFLLNLAPLVYSTWESEGQEATEKTLTMVTRVYLILCLPAAVGLSVLAFPFVAFLTAPDYYEGYRIVGFVVFSSFAWGLSNIAMMGAIKKKTRRIGSQQDCCCLYPHWFAIAAGPSLRLHSFSNLYSNWLHRFVGPSDPDLTATSDLAVSVQYAAQRYCFSGNGTGCLGDLWNVWR